MNILMSYVLHVLDNVADVNMNIYRLNIQDGVAIRYNLTVVHPERLE